MITIPFFNWGLFGIVAAFAHGLSATEYSALSNLFNQTNGKEWWLSTATADPCLWDGISCLNNQLYSLDLSNSSMSGVLVEETLLALKTLR